VDKEATAAKGLEGGPASGLSGTRNPTLRKNFTFREPCTTVKSRAPRVSTGRTMDLARAGQPAWAIIYVLASPLLLFFVGLVILASTLGGAFFAYDPLTIVAQRHAPAWAMIKLTGQCTLGLLSVALLLRFGN